MKKFILLIIILLHSQLSVFAGEKINVAFCIDNKYPLYTMLAMNSIFKNNSSNSKYNFYVLENDLSFFNKLTMILYVKLKGHNIEFKKVDTTIIDHGKHFQSGVKDDDDWIFISRIAAARFLIADILKDVHKILYLDADILVLSDLKELYETDLEDNILGMVPDQWVNKEGYCNGGIILMNLDAWRKSYITYKIIKYTYKNTSLEYADQDIINNVLSKNIKSLDKKWNAMTIWDEISESRYISNEISKINIIHYVGGEKPWMILPRKMNKYEKLYDKYWGNSWLRIYRILERLKIFNQQYIDFPDKVLEKFLINKTIIGGE